MGHIGSRSLLLAIDGRDYTDEVSRAVILSNAVDDAPGHWLTPFADVRPRYHSLALTFAQDTDANSLLDLGWSRVGDEVAVHLAPHGNLTASASQPHYEGTVCIVQPDELVGGDADVSRRTVMTTQVVWPSNTTFEVLRDGELYPADPPEGWWAA